jgi:hypothetical protein
MYPVGRIACGLVGMLVMYCCWPASVRESEPAKVIIQVYDYDYQYPEGVLATELTLHPTGVLTAPISTNVDDDLLKRIVNGQRKGKPPYRTYICISPSKEADVSTQTLGKALQKIRQLAEPETIVDVRIVFLEVAPIRKKASEQDNRKPEK